MSCNQNFFMKLFYIAIFIFSLLFVFTFSSFAQQDKKNLKAEKKAEEVDLKKKRKELKIFMDKIEILGRIEKPQTVFIIPGSDPTVDDIQIDRSFFKKIFRSIEKDNFSRIVNKEREKPIIW